MTSRADRVAYGLATWLGCGRLPAPGTMGTLGALPLYLAASRAGPLALALTALGVTGAGVWAAGRVAKRVGSADPPVVVVDEVAGFLVTMLGAGRGSPAALVVGFGLFRLLDIAKPPPVRRLERLPGGWGIVLDDLAAGAMAAVALAGLRAAGALR